MITQVSPVIGGLEKELPSQKLDIKFCRWCVVSNQRPRIVIDEDGVCSACRFAYEKYHVIDWSEREQQLERLLELHRRNDGFWDVVVPGSGGKDSDYVAHQLKTKYGMHPSLLPGHCSGTRTSATRSETATLPGKRAWLWYGDTKASFRTGISMSSSAT